jgi:hypothetical protein
MKALLSTLAILAMLAIPAAWILLEGIDFGIDSKNPLGTFSKMDEYLREKGCKKGTIQLDTPDTFTLDSHALLKDLTCYEYADPKSGGQASLRYHVVIGVDAGGKVRCVGGRFMSRSGGFSTSGPASEEFLATYFEKHVGKRPTFEKRDEPGVDLDEYLWSEFTKGKIHGVWKKKPTTGDAKHTNTIFDHVLVWMQ